MIREVLDAVEAQFLAVLETTGETPPSFGLGEDKLADADVPPRVIWVPLGGRTTTATKSGGDGVRNPGALWSRTVQLNAHIWADDITAAEALAGHLVAAMHFVICGSYSVTGETWDTKGATDEGVLCIIEFQLRMPFTRERLAQVVPETIAVTPEIEVQ